MGRSCDNCDPCRPQQPPNSQPPLLKGQHVVFISCLGPENSFPISGMAAGHWQATDLNDNSQVGGHAAFLPVVQRPGGDTAQQWQHQPPEQEVRQPMCKMEWTLGESFWGPSSQQGLRPPPQVQRCSVSWICSPAVQSLVNTPGSSSGGPDPSEDPRDHRCCLSDPCYLRWHCHTQSWGGESWARAGTRHHS